MDSEAELKRLQAENAELRERLAAVARTDELTGLPNRRAWNQELLRETSRANRRDHSLAVVVLNLDRFEVFNEEHGAQAADALLRETGAMWRLALRTSDFIARFGGDEFAVLLPDCPPVQAVAVLERLLAYLPSQQTCSGGIAHWNSAESAAALVGRAGEALQRAKAAGVTGRSRRTHSRSGERPGIPSRASLPNAQRSELLVTTKAAFNAEDWSVLASAPFLTGMLVIAADRGGTVRESLAISRAYTAARGGDPGELLQAIVSTPPAIDPSTSPRSPEDLRREAPATLRRAVGILEQTASDDEVVAYKRFVYSVADGVARAHREGGFLGIGGTEVSEHEQAALDEIAAIFDEPPSPGAAPEGSPAPAE